MRHTRLLQSSNHLTCSRKLVGGLFSALGWNRPHHPVTSSRRWLRLHAATENDSSIGSENATVTGGTGASTPSIQPESPVEGGLAPPAPPPAPVPAKKPRGKPKKVVEGLTTSALQPTAIEKTQTSADTGLTAKAKKPRAPPKKATPKIARGDDPIFPTAAYGASTASSSSRVSSSAVGGGSSSAGGSGSGRSEGRSSVELRMGPAAGGLWDKPRLWVVFSDLHVSEKTLGTCLSVLRKVHEEAVERQAGIVFLGDFWDERAFLPVEPLNAIMNELDTWTCPMLMLVGNHDQVDLGGNLHALSPLETAWPERIHVFTEPALFRGALWLPYRRSQDQLREALRAGVDYGVKAVMAHADVQTARFNYQAQSREGVPPNLFPPRMPVYTGHYHLPHTVDNTTITYVGSPYQVTASEAGERKRLHVLDAQDGWTLSHTIPINVGPRHHRANSSLDLAALCTSLGLSPISPAQGGLDGSTTGSDGDLDSALQGSSTSSTDSLSGDEHGLSEELGDMLRPGDRLKLSLVEGEMEDVESFQMELEKRGISVELSLRPTPKGPRMDAAEDRPVLEMLQEYGMATHMSPEALALASDALKGQIEMRGLSASGDGGGESVNIRFDKVVLEGYGPFREQQTYLLSDRGLRVVSGNNRDDAGTDSNGSGKTCLVTAPLWALTGGMMSRTEGSGGSRQLVDLMLNDSCKEGCVVVEGCVNGKAFTVERVIKKGKTARLLFTLDGVDITQADISRTQERIRLEFNSNLLKHTVFFGQNDITSILEADDATFKELLGQVVEMKVWESAREALTPQISVAREGLKRSEAELNLLSRQLEQKMGSKGLVGQQQVEWHQKQESAMALLRNQIEASRSELTSQLSNLASAEATLTELHTEVLDSLAKVKAQAEALRPPPMSKPTAPKPSLDSLSQFPGGGDILAQLALARDASHDELAGALRVEGSGNVLLAKEDAEIALAQEKARLLFEAEREVEQNRRLEEDMQLQASREEGREALVRAKEAAVLASNRLQAQVAEVASHTAAEKMLAERLLKYRTGVLQSEAQAVSHVGSTESEGERIPVCNQCLQEINEDAFMANISAMEEDVSKAGVLVKDALALKEEIMEGHMTAVANLSQAQQACNDQMGAAVALARQRQQQDKVLGEAAQQEASRLSAAREQSVRTARREAEKMVKAAMAEQERDARREREDRERAVKAWQEKEEEARSVAEACRQLASVLTAVSKERSRWSQDKHYQEAVTLTPTSRGRADMAGGDSNRKLCEHASSCMDACGHHIRQLWLVTSQLSGHEAAVNPFSSQLQGLVADIEALRSECEATEIRKSELSAQQQALKEADHALGRGGIRSFVLEGVLGELQGRTSTYLAMLSDSMSLELSSTRPLASSTRGGKNKVEEVKEEILKIVKVRHHGGQGEVQRSLSQLSGGERRRLALALSLGFVDLARQRGRMACNLLVLDEVLQHLDGEGCARVALVLRELPQDSILLVGQAHSFVTSVFDVVDNVVKERGGSAVVTG